MPLKSTPFLKILLPYLLGIIVVLQFGSFAFQHLIFIICTGLLLAVFILLKLRGRGFQKHLKILYVLLINAFLILLAFETSYFYKQTNDPDHYTHYIKTKSSALPVVGMVSDIPVLTEKFFKIPLQIEAIYEDHQWKPASGGTYIYADKRYAPIIKLHDRISVNSQFSIIQPPANPYEFDYASYLKDRNIYHVVFAKEHEILLLNAADNISLSTLGTYLKYKTTETLRNSGLSQEAFSICSALLVGYDDEIDSSVMSSFSHSGTLHVLSVSGLHTGILYACIVALFGLFDKHDKRKKLKCFVVLLFMLLLAGITGFAPAVCRAVIMLSLVLIGKTFFRNGNSFNTLILSAFILLLFDPYLVKDLGFLLSYFAVLGIMYLYPKLSALYTPDYKIVKWIWDSTLLSLSATLFTLPISLYYFHQFPTWFIFSNLLIIPLSIFIMLAAALLLLLGKIVFIKTSLVFVINSLTTFMIYCSQLTDKPGTGYLDLVHFSWPDIVWMSLTIVLAFVLVEKKRFVYALSLGLVIIAWLLSSTYHIMADHRLNEVIVFKTKRGNSVLMKQHGNIYYVGDSLSPKIFDRIVKPYLQHINYRNLFVTKHKNFIRFNNQTICLLNTKVSENFVRVIHPDILVVSQHRLKKHSNQFEFATVRHLVATLDNKRNSLAQLKQQCNLYNIDFHSVNEEGAFRLALD